MGERSPTGSGTALVRGIGFTGVAMIVLNSVIGAGIFALPAAIAARAGAVSPWLFLLCGLLVMTVVLTYAELASYFRNSGGPVLYTGRAFGPLAGFTAGWLLFLGRMASFAANTNVLVIYGGSLWPWMAEGSGRTASIAAVCATLTLANYFGVRDGVRTIGLFTLLKVLPLLLLILLGLPYVGAGELLPGTWPEIASPGETALLLIYAFVGFEAATITAGETSRPKRNLPLALLATVACTAVFYFLIVLVYVAVLPPVEGMEERTLVDVGRALLGPVGAVAVIVAAVFSIGGNLASTMLTIPRLTFALAEQRLLPRWFGRVHRRFRTPGNSILFLGALSTFFALTGSFLWLAAASSLMRLIVYILCIGALPVIRRTADERARSKAFRVPGGYIVPAIALCLCIWVAVQSTRASWQITGFLLLAGLMLYSLARLRGRHRAPQLTPADPARE